MYNYDLLMSILNTFEQSVYSDRVYEGDFLNSKEYNYIKKASIDKLNDYEDVDESYLRKINNFIRNNEKMYLPFEAVLLINKEINNYINEIKNKLKDFKSIEELVFLNRIEERERDNFEIIYEKSKEYNNKIFEIIYNKNFFNISNQVLEDYYFNLSKNISSFYNNNYYLTIMKNKFSRIKKFRINNEEETRKSILLKYKIDNTKSYEVFEYLTEYDNYIFTLDGNIKFLELESGTIVQEWENIGDLNISYYNMFCNVFDKIYKESKDDLIFNNLDRLIFYSAVDEIKNGKNFLEVSYEIKEFIKKKKDLFDEDYFNEILELWDPEKFKLNNYVKALKENPTNENLESIIRSCSSAYEILYVMTSAENILEEEINGVNYVESILNAYEKLKKDNDEAIKYNIAMYIEELINKKPLIFQENIEILKEIYNDNVFTEYTVPVLKYLNNSVDNEEIIEKASLMIKVENNEFDNSLLEIIYDKYKEKDTSLNLDIIINKIIYNIEDFSNNFKNKDELIELIYNFYKKYDDLNALKKLVLYILKKEESLKENGIEVNDLKKIDDFIINLDEIDNIKRLEIFEEYIEDKDILEKIKIIMEKIYDSKNEHEKIVLKRDYARLLKELRNDSDKLYKYYLYSINNEESISRLTDEEVKNLEEKLNVKILNTYIKEKINSILVIYYIINKNDEEKLKKYLKEYLEKYSSISESLFKRILGICKENIEKIEFILKNINFFDVNNGEFFLKEIFDLLLINERLDLADEILDYYIVNKKEVLAIDILKKYLKNAKEIDEFVYRRTIKAIFEDISQKDEKEKVYILMSNREDFPIEMREKYYKIYKMENDKNKIIEAFLNKETYSIEAKILAANKYFNDDTKFFEIFEDTEYLNNLELIEILNKKIKEKFKTTEGKNYLNNFIFDIKTDDIQINNIKKYLEEFLNYRFGDAEQTIFGEYRIINPEENDFIKEGDFIKIVELENVFNSLDRKKCIIIENSDVSNIILKYLKEKKVNFKEEKKLYSIKEENDLEFIKNGEIELFIENIKELIQLQQRLIKSNAMISRFNPNKFIINKKGFIINSHDVISYYQDNLKIIPDENENSEILKLKKRKYLTLNEENICKIIQIYIKEILEKIVIKESFDDMRVKFIEKVLLIEINSYDLFISEIDNFLENEKKRFEDIAFLDKLNRFEEFDAGEKKIIINTIINKLETTKKSKDIILSVIENIEEFDFEEKEMKGYLFYLLECFNEYYHDIEDDDLIEMYDFINEHMEIVVYELANEEMYLIENFYIKASKKAKKEKYTIKEDVKNTNLTDNEKEYIIKNI